MKVRMKGRQMEELIFEESFPDEFRSPTGLSEKKSTFSHQIGTMSATETWFEGILINYGEATLHEEIHLDVESDASVIEMHFSLSGKTGMKISGASSLPDSFGSAEHNIIYTPAYNGDVLLKPSPMAHRFFEVHLTETFFKKLVLEESTMLAALAKKIEKKEMAALSKENLGITARMNSIIFDMMNCNRSGSLQRIYLESKVLELLMLQAEQFEQALKKPKPGSLQRTDIEKLHHIRWVMEQNPEDPLSLTELAKKGGLNEYKLKKGFREMWGTTVFGYLHELRMKQARHMLLDLGKTVGEAADQAGYRNAHHFTAAFKKFFGYLPSQLKGAQS
ncbi:AraC family transcriptional regulator [Fulvivirgaceae bacterium PWU4]|uniref:AraC family transcriptional regulator n=1 Tax=Chryseosolibacter histidini TaxID=2782349 RepID=A0AAP2DGA4_9BACT|nr:AraC family transcriptional regulator [Chryseosolibacter histidini]MBT1695685.1 AraC family transcriptional regulator [Chryseosolibacter histidini]